MPCEKILPFGTSFVCRWQIFDLVFTLFAAVITFPAFFFAVCYAFVCQHRPIFFKQHRIGFNCEVFSIYKLRSMSEAPFSRRQYVTKIGFWLRKTSLDEIPSFVNVLKGELSWVGPRPLLFRDLPILFILCHERFEVRPGITGITQVAGGNLLSWRRRLSLDASYITRRSFFWHLAIISMTFAKTAHFQKIFLPEQSVSAPLAVELET